MVDPLATIAGILETLGSARGAGFRQEHIALLEARLAVLKDEVCALKAEIARLEQMVREAEEHRAQQPDTRNLLERKGALFQRLPSGHYDDVVYCPRCRTSTFAFPPGENFVCEPCGWTSPFLERDLPRILAVLNAEASR